MYLFAECYPRKRPWAGPENLSNPATTKKITFFIAEKERPYIQAPGTTLFLPFLHKNLRSTGKKSILEK